MPLVRDAVEVLGPGPMTGAVRDRELQNLLARAMRDNPTHVAVFGHDAERRERRLRAFFAAVLPWLRSHGEAIIAVRSGTPIGLMFMLPAGTCQPGVPLMARLARTLLTADMAACLPRMLRWHATWRHLDPPAAHWHLGPLAVEPVEQGRGVGSGLLHACCRRLAREPHPAWLETDRERNVRLYRRFDFTVASQRDVLGVNNWFMQRPGLSETQAEGRYAIDGSASC